jgi:hypothetical protein
MKQRHQRRTGQDEPQTITKAVTHIRVEAINGGKLAALDALASVHQAVRRKPFGSEATKRAGCHGSSPLQRLAGADESAGEFPLDASAFFCRERRNSSARPALSDLLQ